MTVAAIGLRRVGVRWRIRRPKRPGPYFLTAILWAAVDVVGVATGVATGNVFGAALAAGYGMMIVCWWPSIRSYGYARPDLRFAVAAIVWAPVPIALAIAS
jgi:hypothetical protein